MQNNRKPLTVLHIDKDEAFLEVAKGILQLLGDFTVDFTQNTKQACQLLKEKNYDVIVSAFYLNGVNGLEFLNQLKQAGVKSKLVLFTVNEETAEQAKKAGIQFIGKIGDPEKVFTQLSQAIKAGE